MPKQKPLVVSKWLKAELKKKNLNVGELSEKLKAKGITRSALYYYVSGERLPSKEVAAIIAAELGAQVPEYEMLAVGRPKKIRKAMKKLPRFA